MFGPQANALRFAAKSFARRAKWSAIGAVLILLGVIFLGVALWIALEDRIGAVATALIAGGFFVFLGSLALAFSRYPPRVVPTEATRPLQNPLNNPALTTAGIVNAVVLGIFAGRAARRRR
jgi:hypothetical protein